MGMRKHAMVLVLPVDGRHAHALRLVAAMRRAVCEYVAMAQRMQPPLGEATAVEATRLLLSLNVVGGDADDLAMARAVAVSGHANQVPHQIADTLDAYITKWRRRWTADGGSPPEKEQARGDAFLRLLGDLAAHQFVVSVVTPADALPCGGKSDALPEVLRKHAKIQFIMLRDEDEQSDTACQNVLTLLRGMKASANRNCSVRQVEDCEIEMQGIVKEWLHAVAPLVRATMQLGGHESDDQALALEIRANFVLVDFAEQPGSSWMALCGALSHLQLLHFAPLASIHPTVLLGCPLRAAPSAGNATRGRALCRFLREERCGGVVVSTMKNGVRVFHLIVASPNSESGELLMHRLASAEEVLVPEPGDDTVVGHGSELDSAPEDHEMETFRKLSVQPFNVFRYRSGIFDRAIEDTRVTSEARSPRPRTSSRPTSGNRRPKSPHGGNTRGSAIPAKKRRL